jgi:hypothetical protein
MRGLEPPTCRANPDSLPLSYTRYLIARNTPPQSGARQPEPKESGPEAIDQEMLS